MKGEMFNKLEYKLNFLVKCIDNTLSNIEKNLSGLYDNYKISEDLFLRIKNNNSHINVNLKHIKLNISDLHDYFLFNDENTNKFLLFYISDNYRGKLNLIFDEEFAKELNNNLKEIFVEVENTDVLVTPSFLEDEKTFLFRCKHPILNNIYFSIVRYSSSSYRFFFMFDVFSYKNVIKKNLNLISKKLESIKSDLNKFKDKYNPDILKDTIYLKEFQFEIKNKKESLEKMLNRIMYVISLLDSIFSDIENINFYINEIDISFLDKIKSLKEFESFINNYNQIYNLILKIESIKEEYDVTLKEMENKLESITKNIKVIKERIELEEKNIENNKQHILDKISKIDKVLSKDIWNHHDLFEFSKEVPRIQNYIIIKDRIEDIKKIIDSEKGIKGTIKRFFSNYDKELKLEEEKLDKEIKSIEIELHNLKNKYKKALDNIDTSILNTLENQVNSYKIEIESIEISFNNKKRKLTNSFKKYIEDLKYELNKVYENLYKLYNTEKEERQVKIEFLLSNYRSYFNEVNNKYSYNLMQIYNSIQNLYETGICEKSYLPKDIQDFIEYFSEKETEIMDLLNLEKAYNKNLKANLSEIINIIKDITFKESPSFTLIKEIEDKIINDLKLII